jgi:tetratricopeptide (TPR) repeat protein
MPPEPTPEDIQNQLTILEAKLVAAREPVVRQALQVKVDELRSLLFPEAVIADAQALKPEENKKEDQDELSVYLRGQIQTLEAKLKIATEPMAVAALQEKLADLRKRLASPKSKRAEREKETEEPLPDPPTPEAAAKAEELIRQARVAKMRNQAQEATNLLHQAVAVAPGSPTVLEALGNELAERKRYTDARSAYYQAHRLAPNNLALERKYAQMVLYGISGETAKAQADSILLTSEDTMADAKWATVLSLFIPGIGHLVLGENVMGFSLISTWLLGLISFIFVSRHDAKAHTHSLDIWFFAPLALMLVATIVAVSTCAKRMKGASSAHRPQPTPLDNFPY